MYIADFNAYESHPRPGMKKSSTTSLMNARVWHYTYDRGWLLLKSIFVYLCWYLYMSVIYISCIHIVTSIFIIENVLYVYYLILQKQTRV